MPPAGDTLAAGEGGKTDQNIAAVLDFYTREEQKVGSSQRLIERISIFVGRPLFLGGILVFVAAWTMANAFLAKSGIAQFDPPPYLWLQGLVGLSALLTANVVLAKQNRLAKLEEQRAHLDLKVNLLTEQKVAKLIDMLEELRHDLPNVADRHDSDAIAMKQSMSPDLVLAALDERHQAEAPAAADGTPPAETSPLP